MTDQKGLGRWRCLNIPDVLLLCVRKEWALEDKKAGPKCVLRWERLERPRWKPLEVPEEQAAAVEMAQHLRC